MSFRVHSCVGMWEKDAALSAIAQGLGVQLMRMERAWEARCAGRWQRAEALRQLHDAQAIAATAAHQEDRELGEPPTHAPRPIARPHAAHAQWC